MDNTGQSPTSATPSVNQGATTSPPTAQPPSVTPPSGKKPLGIFIVIGVVVVIVAALAFVLPSLNRSTEPEPVEEDVKVEEEEVVTPTEEPTDVSEGLTITISSPIDGSAVSTSSVTVSGTTSPLADVFVNDTELKANSAGNFSTTVTLDEGENTIAVSANDAEGNYAEKQITVTYEPAE